MCVCVCVSSFSWTWAGLNPTLFSTLACLKGRILIQPKIPDTSSCRLFLSFTNDAALSNPASPTLVYSYSTECTIKPKIKIVYFPTAFFWLDLLLLPLFHLVTQTGGNRLSATATLTQSITYHACRAWTPISIFFSRCYPKVNKKKLLQRNRHSTCWRCIVLRAASPR